MTPEGQEVVRRLVETADVVVANLPPQTLAAMKLDYDSLAAIKPDIILTMVTAYGRGGPYSDRVGFDGIGQVMSGAVYMTGCDGAALSLPGALGRFRHGAALRLRHADGADGAPADRPGPGGRGRAAGHRGDAHQRDADRAGGDRGRPRADRQPRPDLRAGRHLPHPGRLDPGAGHRPAALPPLGAADGRGPLARRSALQGRHLARRATAR